MASGRKRIPVPKAPRILYKYCGRDGIAILDTLELKLTQPNEFNDPFEWGPSIVGQVRSADIARFIGDAGWRRHWGVDGVDVAQFDSSEQATLCDEWAAEMNDTVHELMACELDRISHRYGILCLSRDPASVLMWSHYADNHRGFVIGIAHRKLGRLPFFPVEYHDRRVAFRAITPLQRRPKVRAKDIFLRKSSEWSYEKEYRMIMRLDEPPLIPRIIRERQSRVVPLIPESIAEIKLGYRCTDDLVSAIRGALAKHGAHARIDRAALHERRFSLIFRAEGSSSTPSA